MKPIQLLLTNPCTKQWDDLQPATSGRYCGTCKKHIVDLSGKSDLELIEFFKKKRGNTCAKLAADQLNRPLVRPAQRSSWQWLLPLAIGAMFVPGAEANELKPAIEQGMGGAPASFDASPSENNAGLATDTIKGRVLDGETGAPLKGVKIREKGFQNVLALTDSLGHFELVLPQGKTSTLTFDAGGYFTAEKIWTDDTVVKLQKQRLIRLGGIAAVPSGKGPLFCIYSGKKSWTGNAIDFKQIAPNWVEKVEILKDAKATALYGSKAADGVVLIEIKKAYANKIDLLKKE